MTLAHFSQIPLAAADPILGVTEAFKADQSPAKVNLGVGVYQDSDGKIPLLECVKQASQKWLSIEDSKTYLPIDGLPAFNTATQSLLFGSSSEVLTSKRAATIQSVGGSGALRLGADFLATFFSDRTVFISDPSWENHRVIFEAAGLRVESYPYYDPSKQGLAFDAMIEKLSSIPVGSIVLLHACCHNPTGVDLSAEQWREVVTQCVAKNCIPFIDIAYQGFADGLEADGLSVQLFAQSGISFLVSNSYAKSFSLYRERSGALTIVTSSAEEAKKVTSQVKRLVRKIYSSPPSWGASVVATILNNESLCALWTTELEAMRLRILDMRQLFVDALRNELPDSDFGFILKQRGMFSYSGLPPQVIATLKEQHHVYALESGRICIAAMNVKNIPYIACSIAKALRS